MRIASCVVGLLVALAAADYVAAQDFAHLFQTHPEHEWLKKFEGEWTTEGTASMGPGQEDIHCTGTMKSRMLGKHWIVSELAGEMQGTPMNAIQTVGYDPEKKKYVGTWVDSMVNHLWKYEGTVDEGGTKLTLEAEGSNFAAPGKLTKFRDAYEFRSPDHIVATSSMLGEDGEWVTFMTGNYKRKK